MKVTFNSNLSKYTSFKAKNKNIRNADDISRRAINTFPMLSSSYIKNFYNSGSKQVQITRCDEIKKKIAAVRNSIEVQELIDNQCGNDNTTPATLALNGIEKLKLGNCWESSMAALAALCANGIYNSKVVSLSVSTDFINKKTGVMEQSNLDKLDHAFVITTMSDKKLINAKDKDIVVIDPWMGFVDSLSGAKGRYKTLIDEKKLNIITTQRYLRLMVDKMDINHDEDFDIDNYEVRHRLVLSDLKEYSKEQLEKLGTYARIKYFNLIKMPQNIQAST